MGTGTSRPSCLSTSFGDGLCWPSCRLNALALNWACLPTQLMPPDIKNEVSHASPKLSPSPKDCLPWNRMAQPGPITTTSVRPDLPFQSMSSTTGTCHAYRGGGVVPHFWLRSLEFPNNNKSQDNQAFASLPGTGMVNGGWHYQTPLSLQGHFGHLEVWGCGLSVWMITPDFWSSRWLDQAAINAD